ncbi:MAG TPA: SOS response-associated peptidase family protein [Chitinophagaceae bacterium]|nr:SOS response-associated peptidase family protein [Chitinophagaceae bacterium]
MCYDISLKTSLKTIREYFPSIAVDPQLELDFGPEAQAGYEHVLAQAFAPYPVVLFQENNYRLKSFEWGVIADYMNTPEKVRSSRQWMCNAQSEKILADKRSYWHRIRRQRCLIPVTGIFEHREIAGWKNKVPYFVRMADRKLFCLPGLYHYSPVPDPETGELKGTFTLITRSANDLMKKIHNAGSNAFRMPLFLSRELEQAWLLPELSDAELQRVLEFEIPSAALDAYPVFSIRTRKPRPDKKGKTDLFNWENLPTL